jgi:hypothetical protein
LSRQAEPASLFGFVERLAEKTSPPIVKLHGLGRAAWISSAPDLHVYDGHEEIEILAIGLGVSSPPSTAAARVEALARDIL